MIRLTNLLNESSPGFENRKTGDKLPTLDSVRDAYQAKKAITENDDDKYTHIGYGKYKPKGKEDDSDAPIFTKDDNGKYNLAKGDAKGGDSSSGEKDKPKVNIFDKPKKDKEEPKKDDGPQKDSTGGRAGNVEVNKSVRLKTKRMGITPKNLGKNEYERRMSQAAVEALTDANFHSEARKLIAVLEDNPDFAKDPRKDPNMPDIMSPEYDKWRKSSVYGSEYYDSSPGTDEIGQHASQEAGWDGRDALDAIAFDMKLNGSKQLALKMQAILDDTNESTMRLTKMEIRK